MTHSSKRVGFFALIGAAVAATAGVAVYAVTSASTVSADSVVPLEATGGGALTEALAQSVSGTVGSISLRLGPSNKPDHTCLTITGLAGGPDTTCTETAAIAKGGLVLGRTQPDGRTTMYGVRPEGASATKLAGRTLASDQVSGRFYVAELLPGTPTTVEFVTPAGSLGVTVPATPKG